MAAKNTQRDSEQTAEERREFLKNAGKAGLALPATALLCSVTSKRANAWGTGSGGHGRRHGDSDDDD